MKRIAQFAAVLAIALLVAQPAFAGSLCLFGQATGCVKGFPMAMAGMGSDCPMASQMMTSGCPMDCCSHAAQLATEPVVAPKKLRLTMQPSLLAAESEILIVRPIEALRTGIELREPSPPLYLLNQVLRI